MAPQKCSWASAAPLRVPTAHHASRPSQNVCEPTSSPDVSTRLVRRQEWSRQILSVIAWCTVGGSKALLDAALTLDTIVYVTFLPTAFVSSSRSHRDRYSVPADHRVAGQQPFSGASRIEETDLVCPFCLGGGYSQRCAGGPAQVTTVADHEQIDAIQIRGISYAGASARPRQPSPPSPPALLAVRGRSRPRAGREQVHQAQWSQGPRHRAPGRLPPCRRSDCQQIGLVACRYCITTLWPAHEAHCRPGQTALDTMSASRQVVTPISQAVYSTASHVPLARMRGYRPKVMLIESDGVQTPRTDDDAIAEANDAPRLSRCVPAALRAIICYSGVL